MAATRKINGSHLHRGRVALKAFPILPPQQCLLIFQQLTGPLLTSGMRPEWFHVSASESRSHVWILRKLAHVDRVPARAEPVVTAMRNEGFLALPRPRFRAS